MNAIKYIAIMMVKNYNNSDNFTKEDAEMKDKLYGRVSDVIELAKKKELDIQVFPDRFVITKSNDESVLCFKKLNIHRRCMHEKILVDFFFGLKRSNNVVGFVSWFKHMNTENNLKIVKCDGSISVSVMTSKEQPKRLKQFSKHRELVNLN